jgi:hypothetical protein
VIEPWHLPRRMRWPAAAGVGVAGVEHRPQLFGGDLTRQPERVGAGAEPPAGLLTAGEVVALHPVAAAGDSGEVVVGPARRPSARCSATVLPAVALPQCQSVSSFMAGRMRPLQLHGKRQKRPRTAL